MRTAHTPRWLLLLKDYWWLATVIGGALVLWGNLPMRTTKLEAGQARQEAQVSELREWTKETQGFLKGQQALNERLANQQQPAPQTQEVSDDGEIKEMHWTDEHGVRRHMCCTGSECWPWSRKTQCERDE